MVRTASNQSRQSSWDGFPLPNQLKVRGLVADRVQQKSAHDLDAGRDQGFRPLVPEVDHTDDPA
jgi:hypothetical protein